MTPAELQVLVVTDLARAGAVAAIPGLPEQLAAEAVARVGDVDLEQLVVGPVPPQAATVASAHEAWDLTTAVSLARLLAAIGWRETRLSWRYLTPEGCGEDGHGWDEWQVDDRSHPAEVAAIRALVPHSPERRALALRHGCTVLLGALHEYPESLEAGVCRYNASRINVDRGISEGDPNLHTTGRDYGRAVLATVERWWPSEP